MNIKKFLKISLGAVVLMATQISCIHSDDWDAPQIVCNNKFDDPTMTLADFVALSPIAGVYNIPEYVANDPNKPLVIIDGYVVSSDEEGNFYKTISFQDKPENPTVGLQIEIDKSMNYLDFPVGAHIRIRANGLLIGKDGTIIKLGIKDPNFAIGRIPQSIIGRYMSVVCNEGKAEIVPIVPRELTLDQIKNDQYLNTLVKVKNVQFSDDAIGKPLMDQNASGTYIDTNRNILSSTGSTATTAVVRTDGFFKESYLIPNKSGDITFVVSRFGTGANPYQNIIRTVKDIDFTVDIINNGPEPPSASAVNLFNGSDFENWTTFLSSVDSFGLKPYAIQGVGTGYNGTNSLHLLGIPTANDYVFTCNAPSSGLPANPTRITFYIKGTATGKSLSFNVYKTSGSPNYYVFNLGTLTTSDVALDATDTNSYTGSIDTGGQWRLVQLNLTGITDLNLTGSGSSSTIFALKTGNTGNYDVQVDEIKIE